MDRNSGKRPMKFIIPAALFGLVFAWLVICGVKPLKSLLLSIWGAGALATFWYLWLRVERIHTTHWFNPSRNRDPKKLKWSDMQSLIDADPLNHRTTFRFPMPEAAFHLLALAVVALFFASILWSIVVYNPAETLAPATKTWAWPAGGIALFGTALTVFYHVRLTARTKNRQEWIASIRERMRYLISAYELGNSAGKQDFGKVKNKIVELELLLNPREPTHRTFLAVIRHMHGIDGHPLDEEVRSHLTQAFQPRNDGSPAGDRSLTPETWVARAIRLSNIILKNEWERVKHAE